MTLGPIDLSSNETAVADKLRDNCEALENLTNFLAGGAGDVSSCPIQSGMDADNLNAADLFVISQYTNKVETENQTLTIAPTKQDAIEKNAVREAKQG